MARYCKGRWTQFLVWLTLVSKIFVSSSPLPTIHQDLIEGEDSAFDDLDVQQSPSVDPLTLPSNFFIGKASSPDASPDAQPDAAMPGQPVDDTMPGQPVDAATSGQPVGTEAALPLPEVAKRDTKESKQFRSKFRRIKSPVRRRNRIMLLLKSEMGKVQIAIEDLKDDCHRKRMTQKQCYRQKIALELSGKLRRIQSAYLSVQELGKEAEFIQDTEVQAQKDLKNATAYNHKAKTMLSGRMIALQDVEKRITELQKEDGKNAVMQSRWEDELKDNWSRMRTANAAQRTIEGYNLKFGAKLKGVLDGMKIADKNADKDFSTAEDLEKKAELVEAHAKLLEDKADRIIAEGKTSKRKDLDSSERSKVQYQENEDGILATDSSFPLDSFGEARAHPTFGMRNFMAQRQPLVGKEEALKSMGKPLQSHDASSKEPYIMFNKDNEHLNAADVAVDDPNAEEYDVVN